jgi:phosphopantothenoylcysteine decarboxylase / phosphopantothenate---cysteine ligase
MPVFYLRNPEAVAVSRQSAFLFICPGRDPLLLPDTRVEPLSELLRELTSPMPQELLEERLSEELLSFLVEAGILLADGEREALLRRAGREAPRAERVCRHLVMGVTGAVGAIRAPAVARELFLDFCERLDVILTPAAQRFLNPEALRYLGIPVWTEAFAVRGEVNVPHIHLASAELFLIFPTSAHTLSKLAHGACSDLLSLTVAATRAPVVLVPAMNRAMLEHPAIARNLARLREDGMYIVEPAAGYEVSKGQEAEPELGGAGLNVGNLAATLEAILVAHKEGG